MAVTYSIDRERALVRTTCVGYITFDEVMKHFQALENDPRRVGRFNVLIDMRSATSTPTTGQLRKAAARIHPAESPLEYGACAIVANDIVQVGIGKLFAALARERFSATTVVETIAEAEAWLAAAAI
jgi:hypothetical protein